MKFILIEGESSRKEVKQHLLAEARKLYDTVLSIPLKKVRIDLNNGETKVLYKNQDISKFDSVYSRIFLKDFLFGEILLNVLDKSKIYIPTSAEAYQISNHKYYTVKVLSEINLPIPNSSLCAHPETAMALTKKIGFPTVVKVLSGFGGKGVMLIKSENELKPIIETLRVFKEFVSTQEYIPSTGEDIRCYVLGDDVIAVKRKGKAGEWRANVSKGGSAEIIEVPEKQKEIAMKAAKLLGLDVCSVDFMESAKGPIIIEVNFTPGIIWKFFDGYIGAKMIRAIYKKTQQYKKSV